MNSCPIQGCCWKAWIGLPVQSGLELFGEVVDFGVEFLKGAGEEGYEGGVADVEHVAFGGIIRVGGGRVRHCCRCVGLRLLR